ncbi:sigma-54 dependent transcriptional regulator, Fis family protein [Plesiocystis pacifica SIR-1]|uniref:Sigma-54 dependent transcriptional regulator, Fis family protein n=2 Tax=Plesiocystis pacifica TaxID=191768 RepID=A6G799_9BACT|nr:sigma-54 dependent transcriptional regulator, Fis family protein [Plesiocystis pacifica SIR-1]
MGRAVAFEGERLVVGSEPGCDLVLSDPRVSRRHLEILALAGGRSGYMVRDLGSKNGTLFEGAAISEARIRAGSTLRLGTTYLRLRPEPASLDLPPSARRRLGDLVGESLDMRVLFTILERAADSDVTVLLEGETGTGKELCARAIHDLGARRRGAMVALDCGALPDNLVESELFGHVKGAFTGAMQARKGAFVRAHGGTLFLDEVDSLPPHLQPRLLRALESRRVRPVGSDDEVEVDVRVVAACQSDLALAVARGEFRPDLYYRLSVLRVLLPPLRARREDLVPTIRELLTRRGFFEREGVEDWTIGGPNLERLIAYDWPGNVRELRNVLDRALALSPAAEGFGDLRVSLPGEASTEEGLSVRTDLPYADAKQHLLEQFELRYLGELMERNEGNISAAARAAGMDRKHLRTLLRKHDLV